MTTLTEGDKAPEFTTKDQNGNTVSLKDFHGKKIVLYFFNLPIPIIFNNNRYLQQ